MVKRCSGVLCDSQPCCLALHGGVSCGGVWVTRKKEPKAVVSEISREEAEWMAKVDDITVRRMVEWLKAGTNVRLPIDTLNKAALSALAEIARATYEVEWSKREAEPAPERHDKTQQLDLLI